MPTLAELKEDQAKFATYDDGDLEWLVEHEAAERGVSPVPPLPPQPKDLIPKPSQVVYEVGGYSYLTRGAAQAVADALNAAGRQANTGYMSEGGLYQTYLRSELAEPPNYTVSERKHVSEKDYHAIKPQLQRYAELKDQYDAAKKVHDAVTQEWADIRAEVYGAHYEAKSYVDRRKWLAQRYARFLELAGGDDPVAIRFFEDAFPEDDLPSEGEMEKWGAIPLVVE